MTIIFIDNSGSVCSNSFYWNEVKNIVKLYDIKKYYLWNTNCYLLYENIDIIIKNENGTGGTVISNIANEIIKNKYYNHDIIIITDGHVSIEEVKKTENILFNKNLKSVECYIVDYCLDEDKINISVPLAFMKNCNSKLYLSNDKNSLKLIKDINIEDYKLLDDITASNILDNYDKIYDLLNIKNMNNTGLPIIKEKLLKIRNDFIKIGNSKLNKDDGLLVQEYLIKEDYDNAIKLIKKIENDFNNNNPKNDIYSKFDRLLSLCDDRRNTGYSLYNKINNSKNMEEIKPVEDIDISNYSFEDPVLLEIDVPQLLLLENNELLFDDKTLKQLIENPLSILQNEELKNNISNRIGHCLGIKITNKINYDPFTRQKIIGTIPLTIDNEQHLKVGNYGLYKLFTNGKIIGNVNLYYIILWKIIKENKCKYLNDYIDIIDNHLIYRLRNSKTYISIQGLPVYNRTIVPLDVALYYIMNSGNINLNILKIHLFNTDIIEDIVVNLLKYKINEKDLKYITIQKVIASMIKNNYEKKMKCLLNSYIYDYIPIDIEINNKEYNNILDELPNYFKKLNKNEILYIYYNKNIIYDQIIDEEYKFTNSWDLNYRVINLDPLNISLKTFRPFYVENWKEISLKCSNVSVDKQISGYNDYIRCYLKYKKFPDYKTFLLYIYNRYNKPIHQDLSNIYNEVVLAYDNVRDYIKENDLIYEDVKKILLNSCKIIDRIRIQNEI